MKKNIIVLILMIFSIFITGIIVYKKSFSLESKIEYVLLYSFNIPNNHLLDKKVLNSDSKTELKDFGIYQIEDPISKEAKKKLQNYFTDAELEHYISEILFPYFLLHINKETDLEPEKVKVEKRGDNSYYFELILNCQTDKKSFIKKICGNVALDDNKKISYVKITDNNGLIGP